MKSLQSLMRAIDALPVVAGDAQIEALTLDSREAGPGTLFVARRGWYVDGHDYIGQAIANGAAAVLVSRREMADPNAGVPFYFVEDEDPALGLLAAEFYDHPTRELKVYGVTGTNGKTSTVWMLDHLLRALGQTVAVISTVAYRVGDHWYPAPNTTPDAVVIQKLAREAVDVGCKFLVMEVSSHGAAIGRIAGTQFDVGGFTNFSRDHLDFHETDDAYLRAKALFFSLYLQQEGQGEAVWMQSDVLPQLQALCDGAPVFDEKLAHLKPLAETKNFTPVRPTIVATSPSADASVIVRGVGEGSVRGTALEVTEAGERTEGFLPAAGDFQILNAALALTMLRRGENYTWGELLLALDGFAGVPGRLELVADPHEGEPAVFVDYAHTPDALRAVLTTARPWSQAPLWAVVGAGGNRDRGKRPQMAAAALAVADEVVFTSDNPRREDPNAILDDVCAELTPSDMWSRVTSRRDAIAHAVLRAQGGVVLIAGKGHERYEEIDGRRYFWDDADEARARLAQRRYSLESPRRFSGWSASHLARAVEGEWATPPKRPLFRGISTDTRSIQPGDVFFALRGENHDAHRLIGEAFAKGAAAAVVEELDPTTQGPQLLVASTGLALSAVARQLLIEAKSSRVGLQIIGITGSNGKTTTRSFTAALSLLRHGVAPLATQGNFNNQIGLPLSVAPLSMTHHQAVLEMGANRAGDIEELVGVAPPDVAVLTSIGQSHLAGFGSLDGVRFAKAEMLRAAQPKVVVLPLEERDGIWGSIADEMGATVLTFGGKGATLEASRGGMDAPVSLKGNGPWKGFEASVIVPVPGRHNAQNLAAAMLASSVIDGALSAPLTEAQLEGFQHVLVAPPGRMETYDVEGRTIIFDAYNANPASTRAALSTLSEMTSPRIAVLGELFELGEAEAALHQEVLSEASRACERVVAIGPRWPAERPANVHVFVNRDAAAAFIADEARRGSTVLWKGSRGARLEQIRDVVEAQWRKEMK